MLQRHHVLLDELNRYAKFLDQELLNTNVDYLTPGMIDRITLKKEIARLNAILRLIGKKISVSERNAYFGYVDFLLIKTIFC